MPASCVNSKMSVCLLLFSLFSKKVIGLSLGFGYFGTFQVELAIYLALIWIAVYFFLSKNIVVVGKASAIDKPLRKLIRVPPSRLDAMKHAFPLGYILLVPLFL